MAITGKIREHSTLVLIIIGGAIMAFVLTDLFSAKAGGQRGPMNIAEVNGVNISPTEFDLRLQEGYENYQANNQDGAPLNEDTKRQIREQVWNVLLSEILLGHQMDELGVTVTSKELFDMVQGENPDPQVVQAFKNPETGQFDRAAVVQFLQNLNQDPEMKERWVGFEKALKKQQKINKFSNLVTEGMYTPSKLAEMDANQQNQKISFKYVRKAYNLISDSSVKVTDSEISDYYNAHQADFTQKASRKLIYASFPVVPSELDDAVIKKEVDKIDKEFKTTENDSIFVNSYSDAPFNPTFYSMINAPDGVDSTFFTADVGYIKGPIKTQNVYIIYKLTATKMAPDSVKARHILISTQNKEEERAETITDSLMQLLNNGADMGELAGQNSDDEGTAKKGGELGWFTEGAMIKPFNDAAFSAEVGKFLKVKTAYGFHIIEVTEETAILKKVQVAIIRVEVMPGKDTYAGVFNKASSFSIDAKDMDSFNELTQKENVQKRSVVLDKNDNIIQGLEGSKDLVKWAKAANEGDVSEAYDIGDVFVVAVLEQASEDGVAPLDKVRNRVEYLAKQEKKAGMYIQQFNAAGATDIGTLAGNLDLTVQSANDVTFSNPILPDAGMEPRVVGKAMSLDQGQMSVPIKGETGVFTVQIETKSAPVQMTDLAPIRSQIQNRVTSRISNGALLKALEKKADITDNRSMFY